MPKSNRRTLTSLATWLSCRLSPFLHRGSNTTAATLSAEGTAQTPHPVQRPLTDGAKTPVGLQHGVLAHSRGRLRRLYRDLYLHGDRQLNLTGTVGQVCDRTEPDMANEASG